MKRVTGIGGVFYKANDPKALGAWYAKHLGFPVEEWGGAQFNWRDDAEPSKRGYTAWTLFPANSKHMAPSEKPFMLNFRVDDLDALLVALRAEGCTVGEKAEESEYGKFSWVMDPEGLKLELWEPPPEKG